MTEPCKTYPSLYEEKLQTATGGITPADREDEYFVRELVRRMGDSAVFSDGAAVALFRGERVPLDPADYTLAAHRTGDTWLLPSAFSERLGVPVPSGVRETDAADLARAIGCALISDPSRGLCILAAPACGFGARDLDRFSRFFHEPLIPDVRVPVAETRQVIAEAPDRGTVTDWRETVYTTCYSPAIHLHRAEGKKQLWVANEYSQVKNWREIDTVTVLRVSDDDGQSWRETVRLPHIRWGGFFEVGGTVYFSGTSGERHAVAIHRFKSETEYDVAYMDFGCGWTSPNNVLVDGGRVYQALGTAAISAPAGADLLLRESWTVSSSLSPLLTREWFLSASGEETAPRFTVMEGNILRAPDGKIYNIMRTETQPNSGYAAILELTPDGKTYLPVQSCNSLLHFPTAVSKFVIRQDPVSGEYLSLTSVQTVRGFGDQRSVLALVHSRDLFRWEIAEYLLTDRTLMNPVCSAQLHSFQYVDFVIDGDDIRMLVREAAGNPNIWHDGTHITLYRIAGFRRYLTGTERSGT